MHSLLNLTKSCAIARAALFDGLYTEYGARTEVRRPPWSCTRKELSPYSQILNSLQDEAPDTYETAEVETDVVSIKHEQRPSEASNANLFLKKSSTSRSSSISSTNQDLSETPNTDDELASVINRAQLRPGEARTRFGPSRVDARGVDFSDRVGGRKSYKVSKRRRKHELEGTAGAIDREDETLKERIARLKREIEEVKAIREREDGKRRDGEQYEDVVRDLSEVLGRLEDDQNVKDLKSRAVTEARNDKAQQLQDQSSSTTTQSSAELLALSLPDPTSTTRALTLAATLDSRLTTLESALGLPALSLPNVTNSTSISSTSTTTTIATTTPLLTTLTTLQSSLQTLSTTTAPSLTSLTSQIDALTTRTTNLAAARRSALAALKDLRAAPPLPSFPPPSGAGASGASARPFSSGTSASFSTSRPSSYARSRAPTGATSFENAMGTGNGSAPSATDHENNQPIDPALIQTLLSGEESETASRITKLHAHLPTIEALAPLLPAVLERLADLRLLHAEAAGAGEAMRVVEGRLEALGRGVGEWRDALGEVEGRMSEAEVRERGNREVVEGWVRVLEGRVEGLLGGGGGGRGAA